MSLSQGKINLSKSSIKKIIVYKLSEKHNINSEEALRIFMLTDTYELLDTDESMLWIESPEYVFDMLESEINNDLENWLAL